MAREDTTLEAAGHEIRHLRERPTTLERFEDGITGARQPRVVLAADASPGSGAPA